MKLLLVLGLLSITLFSCAKNSETGGPGGVAAQDQTNQTIYTAACFDRSVEQVTLASSQLIYERHDYTTDDCSGVPAKSYREVNDYVVVGVDPEHAEIKQINLTRRSSYTSFEGREIANSDEGTIVYSILYIKDTQLRIGVKRAEDDRPRDGTTPERRFYFYSERPYYL